MQILKSDHILTSSYPHILRFLAPLLVAVVAALTLAMAVRIGAGAANDFTVFLESARALRAGADLYQTPLHSGPGYNLNTPPAVLLFVPLSFLPDAIAMPVWTALSLAAFLLAAWWIARAVLPGGVAIVAAVIVVSQGAITSLLLGQITAVLTLLITAAWIADRRERPVVAGVLLGIAVALKPFLAVFAAYAIWRRSRPFALALAAAATATIVAGLIVPGPAAYVSWLGALAKISWTGHVLNASLLGLLTRTLAPTPDVLHVAPLVAAPALVQPLWWAALAALAAVAGRALWIARSREQAWSVLLVGSLLASPLGWVYYAPMLTGPVLATAIKGSSRTRTLAAAAYACLLVPPAGRVGPVGTLLHGSIYTWALVLLFAAASRPGSRAEAAEPAKM